MGELDAAWARHLAEAAERARSSGRQDLAEYLALRAANDEARAFGVAWLLDTFSALADEAMLRGADFTVTREDPHSFRTGHSTMVGQALVIRSGVRTLTVEAGWPRTPADGFVRGGGLARARLRHFGDRRPDEELVLARDADAAPRWLPLPQAAPRHAFEEAAARRHLAKLLG